MKKIKRFLIDINIYQSIHEKINKKIKRFLFDINMFQSIHEKRKKEKNKTISLISTCINLSTFI